MSEPMRYSISIDLTEPERRALKELVEKHRFDFEPDTWKDMTENALKEALVYCIVTTQTREDEVKRFDSARNTKTLWTLPVRGIQRVLERYNIRFPHKKAPWIASLRNVQVAAVIKEAVRLDDGTLRSARKVRTALRNGLGLKGMGD